MRMSRRTAFVAILLAGVGMNLPGPIRAQETPEEGRRSREIQINAMASTSIEFNANRPAGRSNQFRVFDQDAETFQLDVVELVAQKIATEKGSAGFRVDITGGSGIPRVAASSGLFRDAAGRGQDIDIHQALVSYIAPVGNGLRLDLGKHVTHLGYEVIDGYDGTNDQATRSFLFGYAIPFTQTGIRASYSFSSKVAASAYLVNGWDNVRDNNAAKSFGGQLSLSPAHPVVLLLNYLGGAEQDSSEGNLRQVFDVVCSVKLHERISLGFNADYGKEEDAIVSSDPIVRENAHWQGAALYARVGLSPRLAFCARGEYFDDAQGARTGVRQKLKEATLTPELRLSPGFLLRGDLRYDVSDRRVFLKKDEERGSKSQPTISLNALFLF
jgi:hypothetical protein